METTLHTQLKRYGMLCVGLLIMSFGIACSIKAELGTSPVSSLPFVLSQFTPLSVGIASVLVNATLILLQILLLRRQYDPIQLIQLPVALAFGFLTDFSVWVLQDITCSSYLTQWMLCVCGILLVGIGVSFEVTANVVTLAGEGMVLAICKAVLSLLFLGTLIGVREGTVAAAIFVGLTARQVNRPLKRFAERYFA